MQCGLLFETVVVVLLILPCLLWSITLWFLRHQVCQQMFVHKSERFASLTLLNYCLKCWADQGYIGGRPRTFHWVSSFHWAVNPPIEPLSEWHLSIRFHDIFADLDLSTSYYSPCIGESARPMGMLDRWVCGRLILWMSGLHRGQSDTVALGGWRHGGFRNLQEVVSRQSTLNLPQKSSQAIFARSIHCACMNTVLTPNETQAYNCKDSRNQDQRILLRQGSYLQTFLER